MKAEFIELLRCPNTGEELKLFVLRNTIHEDQEVSDKGLQSIKKYCLNNDCSKVLYNTSFSFIYPVINETPLLDPSKAYSIRDNSCD